MQQRAPSAVKAVRTFAQKAMGTKKVLLEPSVNEAIWGKGIKNVPHRLRVRLHRKRNDNEDAPADEKLYTQVSVVPTTDFKVSSLLPLFVPRVPPVSLTPSFSSASQGLQTTVVDAEEA